MGNEEGALSGGCALSYHPQSISGVMDDRGKFIYVTEEEMAAGETMRGLL